MDDKHLQKSDHFFPGPNVEEDTYGTEDCKPVTIFSLILSFSLNILLHRLFSCNFGFLPFYPQYTLHW